MPEQPLLLRGISQIKNCLLTKMEKSTLILTYKITYEASSASRSVSVLTLSINCVMILQQSDVTLGQELLALCFASLTWTQ